MNVKSKILFASAAGEGIGLQGGSDVVGDSETRRNYEHSDPPAPEIFNVLQRIESPKTL